MAGRNVAVFPGLAVLCGLLVCKPLTQLGLVPQTQRSIVIVDTSGHRLKGLFDGIQPSPKIVRALAAKFPVVHACQSPPLRQEGILKSALRAAMVTTVKADATCTASTCAGTRTAFQDQPCPASGPCSGSTWGVPYSNGNYSEKAGWKYSGGTSCNGCVCTMVPCTMPF